MEQITTKDTDMNVVMMLFDCPRKYKAIHPILRKERWIGLSDTDYVRLSPSLVVATYLLECYQTTLFLSSLLEGPRTATTQLNTRPQRFGLPVERFHQARGVTRGCDMSAPLQPEQRSLVSSTLLWMSRVITLEITSTPEQFQAAGITIPGASRPGDYLNHRSSVIELSARRFSKIDTLAASTDELLERWFLIASVLVHEIMHATYNYRESVKPEPIFEDQGFNEIGHAWEAFVFGGSFAFLDTSKKPGYVPPTGALVTAEGVYTLKIPHRMNKPILIGELHAVKRDWLWSIFSDDFWSRAWPASWPNPSYWPDATALQPTKVLIADIIDGRNKMKKGPTRQFT